MKLFVWTDELSYLAVAHAESMAKAREMLIPEIGGWDGSCPERTQARLAVEQVGAEIWQGPVAHFAIRDSEMVRQLESEKERQNARIAELEAALAAERQKVADLERESEADGQAQDLCLKMIRNVLDRSDFHGIVEAVEAVLKRVADLERAHENQRVAINQVLMSKRNEHASWEQVVEEIRHLQAEVAELERDREQLDFVLDQGMVFNVLNDERIDTRLEIDCIFDRERESSLREAIDGVEE